MDEEQLIMLVSEYSELYDVSDKNYLNHNRKDNIWKEIGKKLKTNLETCKRRWKTLRDGFLRAAKKTITKSGQAAKTTRKWRYWDTMSFLLPYIKNRETHSNVSHDTLEDPEEEDESDNVPVDSDAEDHVDNHVNDFEDSILSPETPSQPSTPHSYASEIDNKNIRKRPKKKECQSKGESIPQLFKEFVEEKKRKRLGQEALQQSKQNYDLLNDPIIGFFINMGRTVKTFPPILQAQVKQQIFNAVNSAEFTSLASSTSLSTTTTNSVLPVETGNLYYTSPQLLNLDN